MSENRGRVEDVVDAEGWVTTPGYSWWTCEGTKPERFGRIPLVPCGAQVRRYRGQGDVTCDDCGQPYNAFGQRLRRDYRDNPSNYDENIGDMEGYEMEMVRKDEGREGRVVKVGDKVRVKGQKAIGEVIDTDADSEFPIAVEFVGENHNVTEIFAKERLELWEPRSQ